MFTTFQSVDTQYSKMKLLKVTTIIINTVVYLIIDVTELFSDEDETNAKGTHTHQQTLLYCLLPPLGRPVIVIDGRQVNKKWRKRTLHPIHVDNKMTAGELLVRKNLKYL